jgi:hypothetical protein
MRSTALLPLACALLVGCFLENASSGKKLSDAVTEMNKATRWGQLSLAAQMVEPVYRPQFLANHAHWGQRVQVADSEVVHVELTTDEDNAVAMIVYQWYATEAMTLHQSVVRQRWAREGDGYALLSETIVQGDARLFAQAEGTREPAVHDPMDRKEHAD